MTRAGLTTDQRRSNQRLARAVDRVPVRMEYAGYAEDTWFALRSVAEGGSPRAGSPGAAAASPVSVVCTVADLPRLSRDASGAPTPAAVEAMLSNAPPLPVFELRRVELYFDEPQEPSSDFAALLVDMLVPGLHAYHAALVAAPQAVQALHEVWVELEEVSTGGSSSSNSGTGSDSAKPQERHEHQQQQQRGVLFVRLEYLGEMMTLSQVDRFRRTFLNAIAADGADESEASKRAAAAAKRTVRWHGDEITSVIATVGVALAAISDNEETRAQCGVGDFRMPVVCARNIVCVGSARYVTQCEEALGRFYEEDAEALSLPRITQFKLAASAFVPMGVGDPSMLAVWSPLVASLRPRGDVFTQGAQGLAFLFGAVLLELALVAPATSFTTTSRAWRRIVQLHAFLEPEDLGDGRGSVLPVEAGAELHMVYSSVLRALLVQMVQRSAERRPTVGQVLAALSASRGGAQPVPVGTAAGATMASAEELLHRRRVAPEARAARLGEPSASHEPSPSPPRGAEAVSHTPRRKAKNPGMHSPRAFRTERMREIRKVLRAALPAPDADVPRSPRHVGVHDACYSHTRTSADRRASLLARRDSLLSHRSGAAQSSSGRSLAPRPPSTSSGSSRMPTPRAPQRLTVEAARQSGLGSGSARASQRAPALEGVARELMAATL